MHTPIDTSKPNMARMYSLGEGEAQLYPCGIATTRPGTPIATAKGKVALGHLPDSTRSGHK